MGGRPPVVLRNAWWQRLTDSVLNIKRRLREMHWSVRRRLAYIVTIARDCDEIPPDKKFMSLVLRRDHV